MNWRGLISNDGERASVARTAFWPALAVTLYLIVSTEDVDSGLWLLGFLLSYKGYRVGMDRFRRTPAQRVTPTANGTHTEEVLG